MTGIKGELASNPSELWGLFETRRRPSVGRGKRGLGRLRKRKKKASLSDIWGNVEGRQMGKHRIEQTKSSADSLYWWERNKTGSGSRESSILYLQFDIQYYEKKHSLWES